MILTYPGLFAFIYDLVRMRLYIRNKIAYIFIIKYINILILIIFRRREKWYLIDDECNILIEDLIRISENI